MHMCPQTLKQWYTLCLLIIYYYAGILKSIKLQCHVCIQYVSTYYTTECSVIYLIRLSNHLSKYSC